MPRKDKNDSAVYRYMLNLNYDKDWDEYTSNEEINKVLSKASKNNKSNIGIPDLLYVNESRKILIVMEIKPTISEHISKDGKSEAEKYAVDGIRHYLKFFLYENLEKENLLNYFKHWKIVGLAVSGDLSDEYNHRVSTFIIADNDIQEQKNIVDLLDESDYVNLFENIDEEKIINDISASSKKINKWLRSVDSQKRPVLLSALMVCLFEIPETQNDFKIGYGEWTSKTIIKNITSTVDEVLTSAGIPKEKINVMISELSFLEHDQDLNNTNILKDILNELSNVVIPLFSRKSNYDIIGKFYEEFLRYAGVANVKKGIVLTPRHITSLFTDLIDIKINDVFLDTCCGTGAFLIAAMNKLEKIINDSKIQNKEEYIKQLKTHQLIGFEKNPTMYSLAISNMMFRGDGKSQIYNYDSFSNEANNIFEKLKKEGIVPSIGFINPPYGGKDNKDNPTKKEIQFLTNIIERVSRYVVIIAPLSTYFKEEKIRNQILNKHTLKYVINMPKDLFMPNAATNTAVAVFETNIPQGEKEVVFYNLKDDGYVLSKSKGRTDTYNKWEKIKKDMLNKLKKPDNYKDDVNLVKTKISKGDEWLYQAHCITDYSGLNEKSFINTIKQYMIFNAKQEMNLLDKDIDEIDLLDIVSDFYNIEGENNERN